MEENEQWKLLKKRLETCETFEEKMAAAYEVCQDMERNRRWWYRQSKQGAFESNFVRFDDLFDNDNPMRDKLRIAAPLGSVISSRRSFNVEITNEMLKVACRKLRRHGKGHLVRTLQLIAKNSDNKKESIWALIQDSRIIKSFAQPNSNTIAPSANCATSTALLCDDVEQKGVTCKKSKIIR